MRYTYDVYETSLGFNRPARRMMTTTNIDEIIEESVETPYYVVVHDNLKNKTVATLMNKDDLHGFRTALERNAVWKKQDEDSTIQQDKEESYKKSLEELKPKVVSENFDKIKAAVNPKHYNSYLSIFDWIDLQWLEAMQYLPTFVDSPEKFEAALELQIRKYLDRNGKKDNSVQELSKAMWYLKFLIAYKKNGGPIFIKDIEEILKR